MKLDRRRGDSSNLGFDPLALGFKSRQPITKALLGVSASRTSTAFEIAPLTLSSRFSTSREIIGNARGLSAYFVASDFMGSAHHRHLNPVHILFPRLQRHGRKAYWFDGWINRFVYFPTVSVECRLPGLHTVTSSSFARALGFDSLSGAHCRFEATIC